MEIVIGKMAGFCAGVKNAVEKAIMITEQNPGKIVYCLGDLVHNPQVMKQLESNGLKVISDLAEIPEFGEKQVIFRAHGVTKQVYEQAKNTNLQIIDLTCPNVLSIHKLVEQYVKYGYHIFLLGEKNHPETIGTQSFCGEQYHVIETREDLEQAINEVKEKNIAKLFVISQTTFRLETFQKFTQMIQKEFSEDTEIVIKNTICQATRLRQQETEELAKNVDYMIIIGGKKSSNTNKLYDIAIRNCANSVMIENAEDLTNELLSQIRKCDKIGIMAGASTPQTDIDAVRKIIEGK